LVVRVREKQRDRNMLRNHVKRERRSRTQGGKRNGQNQKQSSRQNRGGGGGGGGGIPKKFPLCQRKKIKGKRPKPVDVLGL